MALKSSTIESSPVSRPHPLEASANCKKSDTMRKPYSKKVRSVLFNKCVKVATIPHIKDFKKEDIRQIWYTEDEYTQCRDSCMNIIRRMDARDSMTGSQSPPFPGEHEVSSRSTRGLEGYARAKSTQRRLRRLAATDAVLSEQNCQHEQGRHDPESLRQVYQHITAPCLVEAHLIALQDEKEARRCYNLLESAPRVSCLVGASLQSSTSTSTLQATKPSHGRLDRPRN